MPVLAALRDKGHQSPADARDACLLLAAMRDIRVQLMLMMRACFGRVEGHQSPADAHDACLFLSALRDIRVDAHDACLFLAALRDIRVQLMLMMCACFGRAEGH